MSEQVQDLALERWNEKVGRWTSFMSANGRRLDTDPRKEKRFLSGVLDSKPTWVLPVVPLGRASTLPWHTNSVGPPSSSPSSLSPHGNWWGNDDLFFDALRVDVGLFLHDDGLLLHFILIEGVMYDKVRCVCE